MKPINEIQNELIDEFALFDNWMDKYEYIISMGKDLPRISEEVKTEEHLIKGCQSRVWLDAEMDDDNKVRFTADSDAIITKGIIALLIRVLSGQEPSSIAHCDLYFIDRIGLKEHLSPTRANGLGHMVQKMKMYGLGFTALTEAK